jgi:hypothetical protein
VNIVHDGGDYDIEIFSPNIKTYSLSQIAMGEVCQSFGWVCSNTDKTRNTVIRKALIRNTVIRKELNIFNLSNKMRSNRK